MTPELYDKIFQAERKRTYPALNDLEARMGFALAPGSLEAAARVLACPYKVNPPNWQHGRLLYAVCRAYLAKRGVAEPQWWLDIGTAKGFSALVMAWALTDSRGHGRIDSVDIVDPMARVPRNSVVEVNGYKTVPEFIEPFRPTEPVDLRFHGGGSSMWFKSVPPDARLNIAFVDGKHSYATVTEEIHELTKRQRDGDLAIFDDCQILEVGRAVKGAAKHYRMQRISANSIRAYVIARRVA